MSIFKSAYCTKEELARIESENKKVSWSTNLLHLNSHNGIRKGKIHILMGPTHSSKSTLVYKVAVDNAKAGAKIIFWASEDSTNDVRIGLNKITNSPEVLNRILVISELDLSEYLKNIRKDMIANTLLAYLLDAAKRYNVDQVYIDNLTTSSMYADLLPADQSKIASTINRESSAKNISFYIVMHTRKGVTNNNPRPISVTDIAGSEVLPRLSQFLYIIQQFTCAGKKVTVLKIEKHRGFEIKDNYYVLDYYNKQIVQDRKITFDLFLDIFQKRQRLYENFIPNSGEEIRLLPFLTADEVFSEAEKVVQIKGFKKRVENRNLLD